MADLLGGRRGKAIWVVAAAVVLVLTLLVPASGQAASEQTRYSLVHGCYALRSVQSGQLVTKADGGYAATAGSVGEAERFRMQATDLGRYLFYGTAEDFLAVSGDGIAPAGQPSDDSDWTVSESGSGAFEIVNGFDDRALAVGDGGTLTTADPGSGGDAGRFEFVAAGGCPEYPEVEINVSGGPTKGKPSYGEVSGLLEGHMHGMAYEFLGGTRALRQAVGPLRRAVRAARLRRPRGRAAAAARCSRTFSTAIRRAATTRAAGRPSAGWPDPHSLTHEQSYWRWIERAWRGGLRVYVNLMVENRVLCELYPLKQNDCNEMDERPAARRATSTQMQDYIDAQTGGPGKGLFRIVTNPFEARKVINEGKLAVVLGMEISEPFNCGLKFNQSRPATSRTDRLLARQAPRPGRAPARDHQQVRQRAHRRRGRQRHAPARSPTRGNFLRHRQLLGHGALRRRGEQRPPPSTAVSPPQRRPDHRQRPRLVPGAGRGAGLSRAAAVQHARPLRPRRVRDPRI